MRPGFLELAVVVLHLKPFTRDETFGLPMITVDEQGAVVTVELIPLNIFS